MKDTKKIILTVILTLISVASVVAAVLIFMENIKKKKALKNNKTLKFSKEFDDVENPIDEIID